MHPLQSVPVEEEWSTVLLRPTLDVRYDLKGLHALALRVGCWNAILEGRDEILHGSMEDHGAKRAFLTLSSFKIRNYKEAAEEFEKLEVPVANCSFGIRLLYALLPVFMSHSRMTIDRLALLLETEKANERRGQMVTWCMINVYLKDNDHINALKTLNRLLIDYPEHQKAWFTVCCIMLMLGDVEKAEERRKNIQDPDLSHLIEGLCSYSVKDYSHAISCFNRVEEESNFHPVAVNNSGICELMRTDNQAAIRTLQLHLNSQPMRHMEEPLVQSLHRMYESRGGSSGIENSEKLCHWMADLVPDDFDMSLFQASRHQ